MKKLLLILFITLFSASTSFGQNNTETEQVGIDNDVTVSQSGSNNATVFQGTQKYSSAPSAKAENNEATISQNGQFDAYIIQGDAGTALNSSASIDQAGSNGEANILQGVYSGGTSYSASASITQFTENNTGNIRQGLAGSTEGGSASITQNASGNNGIIYQGVQSESVSEQNTAEIAQNGHNNSSTTILQGSELTVAAPGSGKGIARHNSAAITQNGHSNGSNGVRIFQGLNGGTAINNTGVIKQNGDTNNATINQGVGNGISVSDSDATIIQNSSSNTATTTQIGSNHTVTITQN